MNLTLVTKMDKKHIILIPETLIDVLEFIENDLRCLNMKNDDDFERMVRDIKSVTKYMVMSAFLPKNSINENKIDSQVKKIIDDMSKTKLNIMEILLVYFNLTLGYILFLEKNKVGDLHHLKVGGDSYYA